MHKELTKDVIEKYRESRWLRLNSDGRTIPNRELHNEMPDEAYLDLIGAVRIRAYQIGDGDAPLSCPDRMQVWVRIDLEADEVIHWYYVDARLRIDMVRNLGDVLLLPPNYWPATLKNACPGAVQSVTITAR